MLPLLEISFLREKFVAMQGAFWGQRAIVLAILGLLLCIPGHAITRTLALGMVMRPPSTPTGGCVSSNGIRMFPGSHDLLVQQNVELDRLQLPRMADEEE